MGSRLEFRALPSRLAGRAMAVPRLSGVATAPGGSGEPVYTAGVSTLLYQDNMERYTDVVSMGATSNAGTPCIVPVSSPVWDGGAVDPTTHQLVTGRGGTGQAIQLTYPGTVQAAPGWACYWVGSAPVSTPTYIQFWFKVGSGVPISGTVAIKFIELFHQSGNAGRAQFNTHSPSLGDPSGQATVWQFYDGAGTATNDQGDQPFGPYFDSLLNDGLWHRMTCAYKSHSAVGTKDGLARMWLDGTKLVDVEQATVGVTPPGGVKEWCSQADVDAMSVGVNVDQINWGGAQTTATTQWTYAIDDFLWWY